MGMREEIHEYGPDCPVAARREQRGIATGRSRITADKDEHRGIRGSENLDSRSTKTRTGGISDHEISPRGPEPLDRGANHPRFEIIEILTGIGHRRTTALSGDCPPSSEPVQQ